MPFTLIKGHYQPKVGVPDGDSVRFLADNLDLWNRLQGKPVKLGTGVTTINTVQLRFEGIDAIEKGAIKPLSSEARDNMFKLILFDEQDNRKPRGYILSRMTDDQAGRPICFVFCGNTALADGSEVWLDRDMLKTSVNYLQAQEGFAYPLFYNTLFASLREEFKLAVSQARANGSGYWPTDKSILGITVTKHADLAAIDPIWPKLWRRLDEYLRDHPSLAGFHEFLEEKNERVDLLTIMEERGLHDFIGVNGDQVCLLELPENLRVVSAAGQRSH